MIVAIVISIVFGIFVGAGWGYILGQHKYDADFDKCYNCPNIWCNTYPGSEECLEWRSEESYGETKEGECQKETVQDTYD